MPQTVWVVERETRKRWSAYAVYLLKFWARNEFKILVRLYPRDKWRVVSYVPEVKP